MKISTIKSFSLTVLFFLTAAFSSAQTESAGLYVGYNFGKFTPGLGNIISTTFVYNQMYDADFNYNSFIHGPTLGARYVKGPLVLEFEWLFRHGGKMESTFIEPNSNSEWKLGFKTRYNSFLIGIGLHYGIVTLGGGIELAKFKLFTKRYPVADYDKEGWDQKNNLYGKKIILSEMFDYSGAGMFYIDVMPKTIGIRFFYSLPLASTDYSSFPNTYRFRPSNMGVSLLFNIINADYK
ncbi:MAG: hypothetical protein PHT69_15855 [Bacteroidales bacterium]|nr:hypothetical protein [Bacteroidales bacterium]